MDEFFDKDKNYYKSITNEHSFQSLTESNKPNNAFRKGIYLSNVRVNKTDEIEFNLLRCSTNLDGPTDNFRETDKEIISSVNHVSDLFFRDSIELNHVLAQTYHNMVDSNKEKKARIKKHSDKTKDMPANAIMAFCSFYSSDFTELKCEKRGYDFFYKKASILTILRFKLKDAVTCEKFAKQFDITLYPNSVFLMSLSTNRLYTHEIVPSGLSIDKLPVRMGYVIRCSNTPVIFKDGGTFIAKNNQCIPLEKPTEEGIDRLKKLYLQENSTIDKIVYDNFNFSLNNGDYTRPII